MKSKPRKVEESLPTEFTNSLGMKFRLIPAGSFMMGSPVMEVGRQGDETRHEVILTKPYYMGIYPVTQSEYKHVMGSNPSCFKGDRIPVDMVSWEDAMAFIERLNSFKEERSQGREYRLPTEAEWEYACRAGSTTPYCFGDDRGKLGDYAWFFRNSGKSSHPVGEKKANSWGLYDMHGNEWEWCSDWYDYYPTGPVTDPVGPSEGRLRVIRGGSWDDWASGCRSAMRQMKQPTTRDHTFRLALSSSGIPQVAGGGQVDGSDRRS